MRTHHSHTQHRARSMHSKMLGGWEAGDCSGATSMAAREIVCVKLSHLVSFQQSEDLKLSVPHLLEVRRLRALVCIERLDGDDLAGRAVARAHDHRKGTGSDRPDGIVAVRPKRVRHRSP